MPPTKTWKNVERKVALFFGALRNRLSGSSGREDITASDSTHPRLFIETKYRKSTTTRGIYDKAAKLAAKENKIPVVCLVDYSRPGFLLCLHCDHLAEVAGIVAAALEAADLSVTIKENV